MIDLVGLHRAKHACHGVVAPAITFSVLSAATVLGDVAPAFFALGHLPGTTTTDATVATGVSANGVVVGYGFLPDFTARPFRWTAADGMTQLDLLPGASEGEALAVSADGTVICGYCLVGSGHVSTVWDTSGPRAVPLLPNATAADVTACAADGGAAAGWCNTLQGSRAFLWSRSGTTIDLGLLTGVGPSAFAFGLSADGSTAVGFCGVSGAGTHRAFGWSAPIGMFPLGDIPGGRNDTIAYAVSSDGSTIVGDAGRTVGGREAFRWTQASGAMTGLGAFPLPTGPTYSYGRGVSSDGRIVAGFSTTVDFQEAFIWSEDTGMRNVLDDLTNTYGVNVAGWLLAYGYGLSPDGTMIVGQGLHFGHTEAWAGILPRPCYANCDASTTAPLLNVNDFLCFQARFAAGDLYANCDRSTTPPVLNVNDFICFQIRFASGCP